jgi:hypothetical protein
MTDPRPNQLSSTVSKDLTLDENFRMSRRSARNIYISSTLLDLKTERESVKRFITDLRHVAFHSYVGDSEAVKESCLQDIARCDLYVLLLGYRYGDPAKGENPDGLSTTHLEFRHAGMLGIPRIALIRESASEPSTADESDPASLARVLSFRAEVRAAVRPAQFTDGESLNYVLGTSLLNELRKLDEIIDLISFGRIRASCRIVRPVEDYLGARCPFVRSRAGSEPVRTPLSWGLRGLARLRWPPRPSAL